MAMVNFLDDMVGQVVAALKKKGMWENLLWATNSDNVSICVIFANLSSHDVRRWLIHSFYMRRDVCLFKMIDDICTLLSVDQV